MTITAKDALRRAKEALSVAWTESAEAAAVTALVEKLADDLSSPEALVRTVQVLWLPDGARARPSARWVLDRLADGAPKLEQDEGALGWSRAIAWAALAVGLDKQPTVAAVISLMRSGAEWTSFPERFRPLIHELLSTAPARAECSGKREIFYKPFAPWPDLAATGDEKSWTEMEQKIEAGRNDQTTTLVDAMIALRKLLAPNAPTPLREIRSDFRCFGKHRLRVC